MAYIAELQIKVDSSQIESATTKLKEFTQATTGSNNAQAASQRTRQDSAKKTQSAEDKAAKAEQDRYNQWFSMADARDKDDAKKSQNRIATIVAESKQRTTLANAKDAAAKKESDADEKRYNAWLKQSAEQAKQDAKQLAAVTDTRTAQEKVATVTRKNAEADAKAQKEALAEQQRIDKIRYQSTLRRFSEEEKAATNAKKVASQSASAIDSETKAMQNLLAAIDPVTRELQRLDALEKTLKANKGNLNTEQYVKYQGVIDEARKKTERYNNALGRTGLTAKQVAMAQQQLPAQFTDIIVSLQGGQAPLTVLLQQGGQLKDTFGGVGPALRNMASYIAALVNPATVAAAALLALTAVWYDGGNQLQKLNGALVLTGNYSGQTTDQLFKLAEAHGQNISSVRQNIEALSQLVKSGKLVPETYGQISEAATSMSTVSGEALDKIIDDFTSLGDEPVKAAIKLNEKYHFLTDTVYQNAQALVENGKEQEAIKLLTGTLAETIETRAKEMEKSARGVAKAWNEVKNAVSNAITAAGRGLNPTDQSELEGIQSRLRIFRESFPTRPQMYNTNPEYVMLLGKELELKEKIGLAEKKAAAERTDQRQNEAAISAREESLKKEKAGWDAVKKAKEELRLFDTKLPLAGDKLTDEDTKKLRQPYLDAIKKAEEAEQKKLDAKTPKSAILDNTDANELGNRIAEIKAQYSSLNEDIKAQQNAGTLSAEAGFAKRQQLLNDELAETKKAYSGQIAALEELKNSKNISANQSISLDRQIADARSKMVVAEQNAQKELKKSANDEEERLKRQRLNIEAYNQSLQRMIENLKKAGERQRAGLSMSSGQRDLSDQMNSEDDRYADEVRELNKQRAQQPERADEIDANLKDAAAAHTQAKNTILSNYDQMKEAQKDWGAGVKSAFNQYVEDGQNYAAMTNQAFTNAFSSMEDAIVQFALTGKLSFADLAKSILSDMARIAVRAAASQALMAIFGSFGGGGASAPAGASMGSATSYNSGMMAAKGAAFNTGGTQFFAKGGAFTNSIVSKPTAFGSASSNNNIMGEAGPEAIMPLKRASDGSLGVRAQVDLSGLQQQAGGGVQVYVTIDGESGQTTATASNDNYQQFGKDLGDFVQQRYRALMAKDLAPGGDIWKATNGR